MQQIKNFFHMMIAGLMISSVDLQAVEPTKLTYDHLQKTLEMQELVVIDVFAEWCGPCRRFAPVFQQASQLFSGRYHFLAIDGDKNRELLDHLGVNSYPTILYYRQGREVGRQTGYIGISEFTSQLDQFSR